MCVAHSARRLVARLGPRAGVTEDGHEGPVFPCPPSRRVFGGLARRPGFLASRLPRARRQCACGGQCVDVCPRSLPFAAVSAFAREHALLRHAYLQLGVERGGAVATGVARGITCRARPPRAVEGVRDVFELVKFGRHCGAFGCQHRLPRLGHRVGCQHRLPRLGHRVLIVARGVCGVAFGLLDLGVAPLDVPFCARSVAFRCGVRALFRVDCFRLRLSCVVDAVHALRPGLRGTFRLRRRRAHDHLRIASGAHGGGGSAPQRRLPLLSDARALLVSEGPL